MEASARSARVRILDVASELFYQEGIRSVGIDTIIERSSVAKATFYYHFHSKDALIEAYLERRQIAFLAWFDAAVQPYAGAPQEQLLALFEALVEKVSVQGYRGCAFINASTEFPAVTHPGHLLPHSTKYEVRRRLLSICQQTSASQPAVLADQLLLLMEGVFASTPIFGSDGPVCSVKDAARLLIVAHCSTSG
ncbi:TetR/AcrR family transcriptional regulator [Dictyobacter kobayashii]|uniref:TetR family transcriptional regulator n=1 Tax=Dictyobacter kobayashii TaxID=2014872 RepID=A0A402ATS7_9CHLR|nr:TetR/AcrR family transcriptional regulator [Dictyobacter kobayashii]GCE22566.1 TetR family transcriptional regulator [Dictyobacter kobayashii]